MKGERHGVDVEFGGCRRSLRYGSAGACESHLAHYRNYLGHAEYIRPGRRGWWIRLVGVGGVVGKQDR